MRLSRAITRINYKLRGTDDDAPVSGSDEYNYWVDTLNAKKDELYQDVEQSWDETYEVRSLGTISASTAAEFEFDDDFLAPSDSVYVITTAGARIDIELVKAKERDTSKRQVFIAGMNPTTLFFSNEIKSTESIVGGTLYVPGYFLPADVTNANSNIPFPDPNWGVMAAAAEIAFNDIVYETKAPDLFDKANSLWRQMVKKKQRGTYGRPRKTPVNNTSKIRSPSRVR